MSYDLVSSDLCSPPYSPWRLTSLSTATQPSSSLRALSYSFDSLSTLFSDPSSTSPSSSSTQSSAVLSSPFPPNPSCSEQCTPSPSHALTSTHSTSSSGAPSTSSSISVHSSHGQTCVFCRRSKVKCDGESPCGRCIRSLRAGLCRPAAKKKRKLEDSVVETVNAISASSAVTVSRVLSKASDSILDELDPVGSFTSPLEEGRLSSSARLSRLLLRMALVTFQRASLPSSAALGQPGRPLSSIFSRCLAYIRYASLLSPQDLTSMLHGTAFINRVPVRQDQAGAKSLLRLHERSDAEVDGHCDGRICGGHCLRPRRLLSEKPLRFSFSSSPREPLDDSEINNFPCLRFCHEPSTSMQQMERFIESDYNRSTQWSGLPVDYSIVVRVNRAFERLFGWDQQQIRAMYMQQSFFALFQLFPCHEWSRVMEMETAIEYGFGVEYEGSYQMRTQCLHRVGSEFTGMLHKVYERDNHGVVVKGYITWIPIKSAALESLPTLSKG